MTEKPGEPNLVQHWCEWVPRGHPAMAERHPCKLQRPPFATESFRESDTVISFPFCLFYTKRISKLRELKAADASHSAAVKRMGQQTFLYDTGFSRMPKSPVNIHIKGVAIQKVPG